MGITCGRWTRGHGWCVWPTDLEGDGAAGAKTGEVQGPRVLGFEQILAGDFSADKFPAARVRPR